MPQGGPGSIGRFGRRLGGVLIDWGLSLLIARGLFGVPLPFSDPPATQGQGFIVLAVFGVMHLLLVGSLGTTIGHRVVGLRVVNVGGGPVRPLQAVLRTVLLCLALPALIWDRDGRGLHDKLPNTVIVRTR
jgi:uncharacterized RDD family membrane protein YckC